MLPQPILIVGPERSGTSLVAQLVHAWGAYPGDESLLSSADERNPRGYWEYEPLWDFFEELGEFASGRSWWEEDFADVIQAKATEPRVADRAALLIRTMGAAGRPWMWKDPALCHFLRFWKVFLVDPVFVCTVRDPGDVAASWQQFGTWAGQQARRLETNLLRWQQMAATVLAETADHRVLFVEYERLLQGPEAEVERLAGFLDRACGSATSGATLERMLAQVEPGLWRNRGVDVSFSEAQRRLHEVQQGLARDEAPEYRVVELLPPPGWRQAVLEEERRLRPIGDSDRQPGDEPHES